MLMIGEVAVANKIDHGVTDEALKAVRLNFKIKAARPLGRSPH